MIDLAGVTIITVDITGVTIRNGRAQGFGCGAGIHVNSSHTLNLMDVVVTENHSTGCAGGIFGNLGPVTLTNSTVSGNSVATNGGGIALIGSFGTLAVELESVTVTGNTADSDANGTGDGGGIYRQADVGTLYFRNSIVAGNIDSGGQAPDCSGGASAELTSQGHNLVQNTSGCGIVGDTTGTIETVEAWSTWIEGLRRFSVAVYLTSIALGLATIVQVLWFQVERIRELPREKAEFAKA